ncbi:MAG: HAD family hydrolase [Tissierellia bacterium]|nr:HAD family hydrolase [Tissierellia bacterium]
MKIKIFASDLDGTLIYENRISEENLKAIKRIQKIGVLPVFITGRIHTSARFFADRYGLDIPIIGSNGAVVFNDRGELIHYDSIDDSVSLYIAELCDERKLYYQFYDIDTFYSKSFWYKRLNHMITNDVDPYEFQVSLHISKNAIDAAIERGKGITKFVIVDPSGEVEEILKGKGLAITKSGPETIEVMKDNVSKYNGLKMLADDLKIDISQTATIGDYDNDIEMIMNSGFGISMGNALDSVKQVSDYTTDDLKSDGVAKAIDYMFKRGIL